MPAAALEERLGGEFGYRLDAGMALGHAPPGNSKSLASSSGSKVETQPVRYARRS